MDAKPRDETPTCTRRHKQLLEDASAFKPVVGRAMRYYYKEPPPALAAGAGAAAAAAAAPPSAAAAEASAAGTGVEKASGVHKNPREAEEGVGVAAAEEGAASAVRVGSDSKESPISESTNGVFGIPKERKKVKDVEVSWRRI
ncbi:hypothetical protein EYF80_042373 [Liparis tanakae]|uniref:Uncharacterized protein n=1 Tax=Liparis tanakae TaxID=230148 RepID=A0A4Z2G2P3_9TELE|nr:hypothetical protein EYF80_042373 [Liparis tanakae]